MNRLRSLLRPAAPVGLLLAFMRPAVLPGDELTDRIRQIRGHGAVDTAGRLEAIEAIRRVYSQASLDDATAALKSSLADDDPRVRAASARTLATIVFSFKQPCPIELIRRLEDPDEDVRREVATHLAGEDFPEGAFEIFRRCMTSSDRMIRSNMPYYVAMAGGNTPETIAVLEEGAKDEFRLTRHNSEIYLWKLRGDRTRLIRYAMASIDERRDSSDSPPDGRATQEQLEANLVSSGMPEFLGGIAKDDPAAFAKLFVEELKNPRVEVRRGTASFLCHLGRLPRPVGNAVIGAGVEEALSRLATDPDERVRMAVRKAEEEVRLFRKSPR